MIEYASGQIIGKRAAQEDALDVLCLGNSFAEGVADTGDQPADAMSSPSSDRGLASAPIDPGVVLAVADGMGGHVGGRVASTISIRAFLSTVARPGDAAGDWGQRLEAGLMAANHALRKATTEEPGLDGMGSTLTGVVVSEAGLGWISIGDSALYLYRNGELTRLNEDHSFGAYLDGQVRDGLLAPEVAAADRRRNHLFYALLGDDLDHYEPFTGFRALAANDILIVASDGLKTLSDEDLAEHLSRIADRPVDDIVRGLLNAVEAIDRDRQDNVSIVAARVREPVAPTATARPTASDAAPTAPTSRPALPRTAANDMPATHRLDDFAEPTGIVAPPPATPRSDTPIRMQQTAIPVVIEGPATAASSRSGQRIYRMMLLGAGIAILVAAGLIIARIL